MSAKSFCVTFLGIYSRPLSRVVSTVLHSTSFSQLINTRSLTWFNSSSSPCVTFALRGYALVLCLRVLNWLGLLPSSSCSLLGIDHLLCINTSSLMFSFTAWPRSVVGCLCQGVFLDTVFEAVFCFICCNVNCHIFEL